MTEVRDLAASLRWTAEGTAVFLRCLDGVPDDALARPTALPGWSGRHLVAHVAANAEALLRLTAWAATGIETPMYTSRDQREADIRTGAERPAAELRRWVDESAERLGVAMSGLDAEQWSRTVRTAQGRLVPATEIPWLRSREVMVHAVDLSSVVRFQDLPEDFLVALALDIVAKRSSGEQPALILTVHGERNTWTLAGAGEPIELQGSLGGVVAYLAGRQSTDVTAASGAVPPLPPWL